MYIYTCECRIPVRIYIISFIHLYTYKYTCIYIHVNAAFLGVYICICIHVYIYTDTYVHICICPRHSVRWFLAGSHIPQWVCDIPMTIELCVCLRLYAIVCVRACMCRRTLVCVYEYTHVFLSVCQYKCMRIGNNMYFASVYIQLWCVCRWFVNAYLCIWIFCTSFIYPSIHEQAPRCMLTETDLHTALLFIEYIRMYIQTHTYTDTERKQNSKWESWLEWRGGERTILQQKHRQPYPCPKTGMCAWVCGLMGARVFEGVRLNVCFTMRVCVCVCVCISQKCPSNVIWGGYDW